MSTFETNMPQAMMATAMLESFRLWGTKDPKYRKLYRKLKEEAFKVINDAFNEMGSYKPGVYEMWWATHHMRYAKVLTNEQARFVHELVYNFLTRYVRGELNNEKTNTVPNRRHNRQAQASS